MVQPMYQIAEDTPVQDAATAAGSAASSTAAAAAAGASSAGGGPFGFLADTFEATLKVMDRTLESVGVPYSYGFAIILLTIFVKILTFPLSKKSMSSSLAMQALQPKMKAIQTKYAGDQQKIQLETAQLYKDAGVNPLAGCLPTLATIPVFIGLYRALTKAADDGLLTSGFFWVPSLGGPTTLTARQAGNGLSWLFPFVDGAPPIGWHDATAYLVLPVLLLVSQYAAQNIMQPQTQDGSQKQAQAILAFLPLMIGWFSLNVPSGLSLYWLVNNILSTGQQLYLKNALKVETPASGATIDVSAAPATLLPRDEVGKKAPGQGPEPRKADDAVAAQSTEAASGEAGRKLTRKERRGQRFREKKAREAAARAGAENVPTASSNGDRATSVERETDSENVATKTEEEGQVKVPDSPPAKD